MSAHFALVRDMFFVMNTQVAQHKANGIYCLLLEGLKGTALKM